MSEFWAMKQLTEAHKMLDVLGVPTAYGYVSGKHMRALIDVSR